MATLSKKRNQADNGLIISIEVLDADTEGLTPAQKGNVALIALRDAVSKRAAKEVADTIIARAQADKVAVTEL
jgi:hypothetical protein